MKDDHSKENDLAARAALLEQRAREYRRSLMSPQEKQIMEELRHCRDAMKVPLEFLFYAEDVKAKGVNLINLEAYHWIEIMEKPLPIRLFFFENTKLQNVYENGLSVGAPFGIPDHAEHKRKNENLYGAWKRGTPFKITTAGYLSLAQGYPFYGLSIGEWKNGLDGQEKHPDINENAPKKFFYWLFDGGFEYARETVKDMLDNAINAGNQLTILDESAFQQPSEHCQWVYTNKEDCLALARPFEELMEIELSETDYKQVATNNEGLFLIYTARYNFVKARWSK